MEVTPRNRVELETRHRVKFAIALDLLVIDVVVAESAKKEICKLVALISKCDTRRITDPNRRVPQRERETEVEIPTNLGNRIADDVVDSRAEIPLDARLAIDGAE